MSKLNVRMQVKNDTDTNWKNSNLTLFPGELALNTTTGELKIATSEDGTYSTAKSVRSSYYEGTRTNGQTDNDVITARLTALGKTPVQDDIFIIKTLLSGTADSGKYSYSAYVFDGLIWRAMDGNVNAENVVFTKDITCAGNYTAVGNITKAQGGTTTIDAAGKTVAELFTTIFTKKIQPTITANPAVSVSLSAEGTSAKSFEVGTVITPNYSASLSAGSYTYGPATGITAKTWTASASNATDTTYTTNSGTLPDVTITDGLSLKVTATATYDAGAVAKDNMGNASDPTVQIAAGTKTGTSSAITGYRNSFYGTLTSQASTVTSAIVRSLATKSGKALAAGAAFTINVPIGAKCVMFAYPASIGKEVEYVKDVNGMNADITSAFTKVSVSVTGANDYSAITYNVYYTNFANANDTANKYSVKIKN